MVHISDIKPTRSNITLYFNDKIKKNKTKRQKKNLIS
jgi:hypothetical protein